MVPGWFVILNGDDENCKKLLHKREDIHYIEVYESYFELWNERVEFPEIEMQVPGKHILFDAKIAYTLWYMLGIHDHEILESLENYNWVWRRMEKIWTTLGGNILMSDYGHHPTE